MVESKCQIGTTCHLCAGPLLKNAIGFAVGGISSAFYGFNGVMPFVQKRMKGPMWLQFLISVPPVIVFSSGCAGFTGGAFPALAQLGISSYCAATAPSTTPSPAKDDPLGSIPS